jgi:hypothetical protein
MFTINTGRMPATESRDEYCLQKVYEAPAGAENCTRNAREQERLSLAHLRPENSREAAKDAKGTASTHADFARETLLLPRYSDSTVIVRKMLGQNPYRDKSNHLTAEGGDSVGGPGCKELLLLEFVIKEVRRAGFQG